MNKKISITTLGIIISAVSLVSAQVDPTIKTTQTTLGDVDPNGVVSSCVTIDANLRYKMKDSSTANGDVNSLQDFLISYGFMNGESTGYFGAGTLKAVKMFQQKQGLSATGYVGSLTRAKIKTLSCSGDPSQQNTMMQNGNGGNEGRGMGVPSRIEERAEGKMMQGGDDKKRENKHMKGMQEGSMMKVSETIMSMISPEDKASLQKKEEALKVLREDLKTYYLANREKMSSSDEVKNTLKTKQEMISSSEKDLNDARKALFDKLKSTLNDEQKKKLEEMMSHGVVNDNNTATMMQKRDDHETDDDLQGRDMKKPMMLKNNTNNGSSSRLENDRFKPMMGRSDMNDNERAAGKEQRENTNMRPSVGGDTPRASGTTNGAMNVSH